MQVDLHPEARAELRSAALWYDERGDRLGEEFVAVIAATLERIGELPESFPMWLTIEAQKRVAASPLSKREIMRRLGTSAAQLYQLLDQTNYRKSVDRVLALLQVLNCDADLVVRTKTA